MVMKVTTLFSCILTHQGGRAGEVKHTEVFSGILPLNINFG